jgi:hypothetical protein
VTPAVTERAPPTVIDPLARTANAVRAPVDRLEEVSAPLSVADTAVSGPVNTPAPALRVPPALSPFDADSDAT